MFKTKIEGIALFSDDNFSFSGGYNPDSHVFPSELRLRGTLRISPNADVSFRKDASSIAAPPMMKTILKTNTITVKRTNRNYIISCKYPVVQSNDQTMTLLEDDLNQAANVIEQDRKTIQGMMN